MQEGKKTAKPFRWKPWAAAAACLVIAAVFVFQVFTTGERIPLSPDSTGVTVRRTLAAPPIISSFASELMPLEEDELFHNSRWELAAFRGTVTRIDNISMAFTGYGKTYIEYRAIAHIQVSKVYQGDMTEGDTVDLLLPCPITDDAMWVEDTDIINHLRKGMEGIFVPIVYDEDARWEENGATLYLRDLAPYGLGDGVRWVFLDTDGGLLFDRDSYKGAADAATLDEVEEYLVRMIETYG